MEAHDDHFPHDTKDPELFAALGARDWVLLTQDSRIRYRTPERDAYVAAGLRVFVVVTGSLSGLMTADIILKARPRIENACAQCSGPFVYSVHKDSTLHQLEGGSKPEHGSMPHAADASS